MLKKLDSYIRKFSAWFSGHNVDISNRRGLIFSVFSIGMPAFVILLALGFSFFSPMLKESHQSKKIKQHEYDFEVPVDQNNFVTSYQDFGDDELENSQLQMWKENKKRDGFEHSTRLDSHHDQFYWLGIEITRSQVETAIKQQAYYFYLDYFYSTKWQIYANSKLIRAGGKDHIRRPVSVYLREVLENNPEGFKISIRIKHDMQEFYPDTLFYVGFANESYREKYANSVEYESLISNSMSFGMNLALGLFFLALWLCGVRKQELAAFAAFGLLQAYIQGWSLNFIIDYLGFLNWHRLNFISRVYEIIIILWLGLSISRIRSKSVLISLTLLLMAPWLIYLSAATSNEIFGYVWQMKIWGSPISYLVAAFICFSQARLVSVQYRADLMDSERVIKLHLSWIALVIMSAIIWYGNTQWDDYRIYNSFLLLVLSAAVVHDYKKQEQYIRKAPLSKYHQRAKLPEKVPCILATIDLKSSEALYNFGSASGVGGSYVVDIISKFYRFITDQGGEVIQTEGDAITFFFDQDEHKQSLNLVINSIKKLNSQLESHIQDCRNNLGDQYPNQIRLRAAVDAGAIKPCWQHFEGRDVPSWEQAANSSIFVDVARLLEAESKLGRKNHSALIFKNETSMLEGSELEKLSIKTATVTIKHGRNLNVALAEL